MNLTAWLNQRAATAAAVPDPVDPPTPVTETAPPEDDPALRPVRVPAKLIAALERMRERDWDDDQDYEQEKSDTRLARLAVKRELEPGCAHLWSSDGRKAILITLQETDGDRGTLDVLPTPDDRPVVPARTVVRHANKNEGRSFNVQLLFEAIRALMLIAQQAEGDHVKRVCLFEAQVGGPLMLTAEIDGGQATIAVMPLLNNAT